jgi:queuine/archaeosine tRNA-ribosyltransferase
VILDSGGFHIQQGRTDILSAGKQLRRLYREYSWAERFALPDTPITSLDSAATVRKKLTATRRQYRTFPASVPADLRHRLLPVVHGTTPAEVRASARAARRVGTRSVGFGGFSTSGPNAGVNACSAKSLLLLAQFASLAAQWRLRSHAFGIGGPAAIAVLHFTPVTSFDSAGWIRTAAYGNVYLPYVGALNITGAAASRRSVTRREFLGLRRATGHICPFCEDDTRLRRSWLYRSLHNYCTVEQVVRQLKGTSSRRALEQLEAFNPRYAGYLRLVLAERERFGRDLANRGDGAVRGRFDAECGTALA